MDKALPQIPSAFHHQQHKLSSCPNASPSFGIRVGEFQNLKLFLRKTTSFSDFVLFSMEKASLQKIVNYNYITA